MIRLPGVDRPIPARHCYQALQVVIEALWHDGCKLRSALAVAAWAMAAYDQAPRRYVAEATYLLVLSRQLLQEPAPAPFHPDPPGVYDVRKNLP